MSDSGVKGRVKGMFTAPTGEDLMPDEFGPPGEHGATMAFQAQSASQQEALQVLTLAQRTAEDHLSKARHEADRICGEARDTAGQIVREAQARVEALQQEAEAAVSDAQARAARIVEEAQSRADQAGQDAEEILSEARIQADELAKIAQAKADELQHLAEQRYEDIVGSLAAKREKLQQQIEALERFDSEYRARLQAFMQGQLRALWVDEPRVDAENLEPAASPAPAQWSNDDQFADDPGQAPDAETSPVS